LNQSHLQDQGLRAGFSFKPLLCQPAVLDDLGLTDEQRPKVKEFCARVGKEWMESLADVGRLSPTERGRRAVVRSRTYETEVNRLLTTPQKARLRQIGLQAEGPSAFNEPEVVSERKLTVEQRERIRTIEEETLFGWMRGPRPNTTPGTQEKSANERLVAVLTEDQVRR
jgi:eukaryotic-like serine/threonine-protein kinase